VECVTLEQELFHTSSEKAQPKILSLLALVSAIQNVLIVPFLNGKTDYSIT